MEGPVKAASDPDIRIVRAMGSYFEQNLAVRVVEEVVGQRTQMFALVALGALEAALLAPEWAAAGADVARDVDPEKRRQAARRLIDAVPISIVHEAPGEGAWDG